MVERFEMIKLPTEGAVFSQPPCYNLKDSN